MSDAPQLPSQAPADDKATAALTEALQRLGPLRRNSSVSRSQPASRHTSPQQSGQGSSALSITSSLAGSPTGGGVVPPAPMRAGELGPSAFALPGMGMTMSNAPPTPAIPEMEDGVDSEPVMTQEEARAK